MATIACTEANILRELEEISNLYNFGLQLGIDSKVLDQIDRDHRNDVQRQRSEIIKYWYRNTAESERTWGRIADAIGRLGGHSNLETKLRQLGTTPTGPRIATTPRAASSPTAFSDDLSPTELVSWLSQQFQAKGLTLDPSLGQTLTDNDINGEAFMDLKESNLDEMGFTKLGQRMKIMKIIQSIKGSKEENGSSQTKAASKPLQTVKATSGAPGNEEHSSDGESGPAPKKRKMDSATTCTSSKKAEMSRIEIASGSLKGKLFGAKEDYSYDVPEGVVYVSLSKEDKSGGVLNIGSGTGDASLNWDKAAKKAYVHAWVNGSVGSHNHVTWTVYGWI